MNEIKELARSICQKLVDAGFTAYFAGGWVRDYLLGRPSKEIDIATSAPPQTICSLFEKTISVGANFGVIIVILNKISFEVSTFRTDLKYFDGRHPEGVSFSTPQEDAKRRDFTINGLFWDPLTNTLYDYVEGEKDLQKKIIRTIGDPYLRFEEDRLRMIRAVRFSILLDYPLEEKTKKAIIEKSHTLFPSVSLERIWQEFNKMKESGHFDKAILLLEELGLLPVIFPALHENFSGDELKKIVQNFQFFPPNTPTICYLLELFENFSLDEKIELCRYLKTSKQEILLATFFHESCLLLQRNVEPVEWAHFYAHPLSTLFLQIQGAKKKDNRDEFISRHSQMRQKLSAHIERIQKKTPLITSEDLKKIDVKPGKQMGVLLKEAERIVVNHDLHDKNSVLFHLKSSPMWGQ